MRRSPALILVLLLAMVAVAGCGTTAVDTSPAPTAAAGQTAAKATIGDTLNIKGTDTELAVALLKTKRLPAESTYGVEVHPAVYGVQLSVKNTGSVVYDDTIGNCVALIDTKTQTYDCELPISDKSGGSMPGQLWDVKIAPGDKRTGWIFFAMKRSQKPRTLQFTADSGFGSEVGEWLLK